MRAGKPPMHSGGLMNMRRLLSIVSAAGLLLAAAGAAHPAASGDDVEKFAGVYQLYPGQFVYIQPWPGGGGQLTYSDDAGHVRALFPTSKNLFTAGPGLLVRTPVEMTITFIPDPNGRIIRLIQQKAGSAALAARKLGSYKREQVQFPSGAERITGILLTPAGKGPFPAMVLIHGTGATDRNTVFPIVQFLLSHGMALLGYDKRGVGESTGDWHAASLEELAADAIAAVKFLKTRKEIDPARIGVFGASQGGWVAPLAAARSADIAYVISVSGPGVSPAEVDRDHLENALRIKGFPEQEISQALALLTLRDAVATGKENLETLQAAIANARQQAWFPYAALPPSIDRSLMAHWSRLPLDYDPRPALEKLHVPVLALFGKLDQTVLAAKNAAQWQQALEKGGAKDWTIQIYPSGNHMLLEARTGSEEEIPTLERFVPAFAPLLLDWFYKRALLTK